MQILRSKKVIMKTDSNGQKCFHGYIDNETVMPGNLEVYTLDLLDLEDGSGKVWVLACDCDVPLFTQEDVDNLSQEEIVNIAKSKLSDEEIEALGLIR